MSFTREFKDLTKHDAAIAGGKGASLGEMTRAGIPVPPGFVLLAEAFEHFLEETDLNVEIEAILKNVDHQNIYTVEQASEKIQAMIERADMPKDIQREIEKEFQMLFLSPPPSAPPLRLRGGGRRYDANQDNNPFLVAVRSSATAEDSSAAAWAGQLES